MVMKNSEKTRFLTTSSRKMIFDILNRNFDFFLVKSRVEMSIFDQKRMKIRIFQNFGLCIVSDVNIVTKKVEMQNMHPL
jgi:hypothetical protein